jgi:hypothetical protein
MSAGPPELSTNDLEAIRRAYERVSARGWGVALGAILALGLFLATAILVVRGGPNPGPHLSLLGQYFPGYRVTWPGAFLGLAYGFIVGYGAGLTVGTLYNRIVARE